MHKWLSGTLAELETETPVNSVLDWAEGNIRLIGSARSQRFSRDISPWINEPLECATSGSCRTISLIKPVQVGGSTAGEIALCYWLATENDGDIQYNWEDDEKAAKRWEERVERILKACGPVMRRAPSLERLYGRWKKCHIVFPHCNFTMQGAFNPSNLDSDTITFQINEEIHNWEPGHLSKAYNRTTAVWRAIIFNISNAGKKGGQLHEVFENGTQRHWEVRCPSCGDYHIMRAQWDPKHPELGGLRYDAENCRLPDGKYDYNRLEKTILYQFPCGHSIQDDTIERRKLSRSGRYGAPRNPGAKSTNQSFTLEAVSVDYIPWLKLIQEKHAALRALRLGDPQPWWRYLAERECRFYDPEEDRPAVGHILLNSAIKKNRDGLPDRIVRFATLDRQQGSLAKNELPHWWLVIRDWMANGDSLLVHESKCLTDEDAVDRISTHGVLPTCVACDSGDDTTHVYQFCLRHGYNAIKGSGESLFAHLDGSRKIFSPEKPLHAMLNIPSTRKDLTSEPLFWHYSKHGIHERLHYLRGSKSVKWEVPGDVSDDYRRHLEAVEFTTRRHPRTGERITELVFRRERYDLAVCEAYQAMLAEMGGLIGAEIPDKKVSQAP